MKKKKKEKRKKRGGRKNRAELCSSGGKKPSHGFSTYIFDRTACSTAETHSIWHGRYQRPALPPRNSSFTPRFHDLIWIARTGWTLVSYIRNLYRTATPWISPRLENFENRANLSLSLSNTRMDRCPRSRLIGQRVIDLVQLTNIRQHIYIHHR